MSDQRAQDTFREENRMKQLNMNDKRVAAWYDAVERHSDRCKGGECAGCERLLAKNRELRAIPGLLV